MLEPFFSSPPDFADDRGQFCVWLTEPLGIVTFVPQSHGPAGFADFISHTVTPELLRLYEAEPRPMIFVHDWRNVETFDVGLRQRLIAWGMEEITPPKIEEITILLRPDTPALMKMAAQAGTTVFRVTHGVRMMVEVSAEDVLARLKLRPRSAR